jgi:hypothetical protein
MDDQNATLYAILDQIDVWQRRPMQEQNNDNYAEVQRERGFQEGLRLGGAIVRGFLIKLEEEQEDDE